MQWITGKKLATATPWSWNLSGYAPTTLRLIPPLKPPSLSRTATMLGQEMLVFPWQLISKPAYPLAADVTCYSL